MARYGLGLRSGLALGFALMGAAATGAVGAPDLDVFRIERAARLELPGPIDAVPTDTLLLDAGGYAQIMCSAIFITGLEPAFAAEHVGYFTAPYASRAKLGQPVIDRAAKTVTVALPDGRERRGHRRAQHCLPPPGQPGARWRGGPAGRDGGGAGPGE